ncbi:DUF6049 family protein [Agreia sp. COWG]|uniref:DUF6049 family protein n=1 Tax=Agreia sp. COWG TaxID=2773266 RepID=UPI001926527A|nr:DUF6049 family protein [Agreia sp. COWG]CAD6011629.1 conserved exported protein of unknown function [Agreia sp. COWG]
MNLPPLRRLRAIPALLGLGLVASSMLGVVAVAAPVAAAEAPIHIVLAPQAGGVIQSGADLTVTAGLTNTSSTASGAGTLSIALDREVIETREGLAEWLNPAADVAGKVDSDAVIATVAVPALPPGEEQLVNATIPASDIALYDWGVYGLSATLTLDNGDTSLARSSVVYNSGRSPAPTPVAVAVPITTQPGQTGLIPEATLATLTAENGLLTRALDAVIDRPVGILVDPRIIASIRALGTTAPDTATSWLSRLQGASNPIYPLSYADADLAAMSQAGAPQVLTPTSFNYALKSADFANTTTPPETPTPAPASPTATTAPTTTSTTSPNAVPTRDALLQWDYTSTSIAWPRDDTVVSADLPYFAANGLTSTIMSSSNVTVPGSAPAEGVATAGDSTVLISDDTVSRALREAANALTGTERQRSQSDLASSLAVVATEDDGRGTPILATLDRTGSTEGTGLTDALTALGQLSWATPAAFDAYAAQAPTAGATVVDSPEAAERTTQVNALLGSENRLAAFSSVIADPEKLLGQNRADLLSLLANSWASNSGGWNVAAQSQIDSVTTTITGVKIVSGSPIGLYGNTANLPVLVQNTLPYPVTITLRLAPSNFRLVVQNEITITVEAASSKQAKVPMTRVANGDTSIRIDLISPTGVPISTEPTIVPVNVAADFEVAGSWLVGSVVAALLIFAAIRLTLRRRRARLHPEPDAEGPRD